MKKFLTLLGIAIVLLACSKNEADVPEDSMVDYDVTETPVTFNVDVKLPETKASPKSAWADGDVIYIVFKGITDRYLYITYNASTHTWAPATSAIFYSSYFTNLKGDYELAAVHYPVPISPYFDNGGFYVRNSSHDYETCYYLYQQNCSYTVSGTEVNVTLSMSIADDFVQLHIPGIQASAGDYKLRVNGVYRRTVNFINSYNGLVYTLSWLNSPDNFLYGYADADGAVFSGYLYNPGVSKEYTFTLFNSNLEYSLKKTRALSSHTLYNFPELSNAQWSKQLRGQFSVSDNKKVIFSPGNLQYNETEPEYKWRFAKNQYDVIRSWDASGWINHFGWGSWTGDTPNPLITSTNTADYSWNSADFTREALLADSNHRSSNWYTLSGDEWRYLLFGEARTNRFIKAKVNNVKGLILFPDSFDPATVGVSIDASSINNTSLSYSSASNYSVANWFKLEEAGCVFLPIAGDVYDSSIRGAENTGHYWASTIDTVNPTSHSQSIYFDNSWTYSLNAYRTCGYCVRLVKNAE